MDKSTKRAFCKRCFTVIWLAIDVENDLIHIAEKWQLWGDEPSLDDRDDLIESTRRLHRELDALVASTAWPFDELEDAPASADDE